MNGQNGIEGKDTPTQVGVEARRVIKVTSERS
jgi:hypothetical protein